MKKIACTLLVISSIALSGCEKKAGGQVVAVVNGEEITDQQLNAEIQAANIPVGADKKRATQQILKGIIDRTVLIQKAKADGIDKTPEYINQMRRAEAQIIIGLLADKTGKSLAAPDSAAIAKFIADNPTMFAGRKILGLDQIVFPASTDKSFLDKLGTIHSMDALIAELTARNIKFARQPASLDTVAVPPEMLKRINALPAGEPFIVPQNDRFIASVVLGSRDAPMPADRAQEVAKNIIRQQKLREALEKIQKEEAGKAKISYRPDMAPPLLNRK